MATTTETTSPISLRLSSHTNRALDILVELTGKSKSELIRTFIIEGLERRTSEEQISELTAAYEQRWRDLGAQIRSDTAP